MTGYKTRSIKSCLYALAFIMDKTSNHLMNNYEKTTSFSNQISNYA